jgi:hypothetical protein
MSNIYRRLFSGALGLGIALAVGLAGAQTINKALQLSQDNTGAFSVDSFLGVYFPGHVLSPTGGPRAAPTVAGTGTPTITGTDTSGTVTMGSSAVSAVVTFGTAYGTAPNCVVSWQTGSPTSYSTTTKVINISQISSSGNLVSYMCMSPS